MVQNLGSAILDIHKLRLMVHLGCSEGERKNTQPVDVDVSLRFLRLPIGVETDSLKDTVCYAELSQIIKDTVREKHFALVEKLGLDIFGALRKNVPAAVQIWIKVLKLHPPVEDLCGGVSFSFGDWDPPKST